jgi:hypothetical protein
VPPMGMSGRWRSAVAALISLESTLRLMPQCRCMSVRKEACLWHRLSRVPRRPIGYGHLHFDDMCLLQLQCATGMATRPHRQAAGASGARALQ